MTWSDEKPAEETAVILFEAMGGKGGVVHLGGIPANSPAVERLQGLENALKRYPGIELLATVFTNPYGGGGITAALAYHAATGTFKPSEEPHDHREFYGPTILVTPDDAAAFMAEYIDAVPDYDWTDFWGPSNGAIAYR